MSKSQTSSTRLPWYHEGLQFQCTGCGGCCTGAPGFVWVEPGEIEKLAAALNLGIEEFELRFVRQVLGRKSLVELDNGDCIFFDNVSRQCQVYSARPDQCRTWPFWDSNLRSRSTWRETCRACAGCDQGTLVPLDEIQARALVIRI